MPYSGIVGSNPNYVLTTVKRTLTNSEILNLFSTPIQLVPAVAGITYVPKQFYLYHAAGGTAYTLVGFTGFCVGPGTTALAQFNGAAFFDSNAEEGIVMLGPGNGGALFSGTDVQAAQNLPLNVFATGANPAAGTFSAILEVAYQRYTIPLV